MWESSFTEGVYEPITVTPLGIQRRPDAGQKRLRRLHRLRARRVFQFLDDAAADHDRVRHRGHRPGGRGVADAEADADRQLDVLADRGDALRPRRRCRCRRRRSHP